MTPSPRLAGLALLAALSSLAPRALRAQTDDSRLHGGIGLSVVSTRGPDSITDESVTARGFGGLLWAGMTPVVHGYATLETYHGKPGSGSASFGAFTTVFTVPYQRLSSGVIPWLGAGVGFGGNGAGLTPVLSAGTVWRSGYRGLLPYLMVERLTRRDRTSLKLGVMVGG